MPLEIRRRPINKPRSLRFLSSAADIFSWKKCRSAVSLHTWLEAVWKYCFDISYLGRILSRTNVFC